MQFTVSPVRSSSRQSSKARISTRYIAPVLWGKAAPRRAPRFQFVPLPVVGLLLFIVAAWLAGSPSPLPCLVCTILGIVLIGGDS